MTDTIETFSEREEIEMLLPWYVTGKLSSEDHDRVARYLAEHPDVARQCALAADERDVAVRDNEAIVPPMTLNAAATVRTTVGSNHPAGAGAVMQSLVSGLRDLFLVPASGTIRWAGAAAALLILAQAGVIGALMTGTGGDAFRPASGGVTQPADGTYALVRFADTATTGDVGGLLTGLAMSIVDGPKPGGLYRVRLGNATMSSQQRDERIAALRAARPIVVLATPAP